MITNETEGGLHGFSLYASRLWLGAIRVVWVVALASGGAAMVPALALHAQSGEGEVGLPLGTPGPNATLEDLEGNSVELLDYVDGKTTLLEFWASWCENCEALQPQLDQIAAEFGDRVNIVAVAVAVAQSQRRVRRHAEEHDVGYPYLWDADGNAVRAYEALTTSVVVILDQEGNVAYTGVGGGQDLLGAVTEIVGPAR